MNTYRYSPRIINFKSVKNIHQLLNNPSNKIPDMERKSYLVIVFPLSSNVRYNWRTKFIFKHLLGSYEIGSVGFFYWHTFAPAKILYMFVKKKQKTFEWFCNWEQTKFIIKYL